MRVLLSLAACALLLISPEIFAGVFDPPPTDKSVELLGVVFGSNIGDIYLGGKANSVLSEIMEKFNFIVVSVGLVVLAYVSVLSIINTAQEGTAMGKKWSAVWVPMRSIMGMALMVPAPASGYSMIQVTVMWIVLQGIGAADQLWGIALKGLANGVSATAGSVNFDNELKGAGQELAVFLLDAAICMQEAQRAATDPENLAANNWIAQKGNFVKAYVTKPTQFPRDVPNPPFYKQDPRKITLSASVNFGVDDSSETAAHQALCGSLILNASVSSDEFPEFKKDGYVLNQVSQQELAKSVQLAFDTKKLAVSTMLSILSPLAKGLVMETDDADGDFVSDGAFEIPNKENGPNPPGYMEEAVKAYVAVMSQLTVPGKGSKQPLVSNPDDPANITSNKEIDNSEQTKQIIKAGSVNGWISAGSFYFIFNKTLRGELFRTALPNSGESIGSESKPTIPRLQPATWCDENCLDQIIYESNYGMEPTRHIIDARSPLNLYDLGPKRIRENLVKHLAYSARYSRMTYGEDSKSALSAGGASKELMGKVGETNAQAIRNLQGMLSSNEDADPLMAHAAWGRNVMILVEVAWGYSIVATGIVLAAMAAGGTLVVNLTGVMMFTIAILGALWGMLAVLWVMGATMAIYAPLIPYMIFTLAAVGWLLTVVEAVIAAPLIALGLTMPSGDEMGKVANALMLLANIFLRPLLMIFGFLLAGGVFKAVIKLINFGMADVLETIQVNSVFSSIAVMLVYITFVISVENLSFSLIYAVPDKILRWLGGPAEQTNVSALAETKQGSERGIQATSQAGAKIGGDMGNAGLEQAKATKGSGNVGGGGKPPAGGTPPPA